MAANSHLQGLSFRTNPEYRSIKHCNNKLSNTVQCAGYQCEHCLLSPCSTTSLSWQHPSRQNQLLSFKTGSSLLPREEGIRKTYMITSSVDTEVWGGQMWPSYGETTLPYQHQTRHLMPWEARQRSSLIGELWLDWNTGLSHCIYSRELLKMCGGW